MKGGGKWGLGTPLSTPSVKSGWFIVYIEGFQMLFILFLSLKNDFVIANSADPVSSLLSMFLFRGF